MLARSLAACLSTLLLAGLAPAEEPGLAPAPAVPVTAAAISVELAPREGTVGDVLEATLTLELPEDSTPAAQRIGPSLGPFTVLEGGWGDPVAISGARRWTWRGKLAAYETGELELPGIAVTVEHGDGEATTLRTEPVAVTIRSVLDEPAEGQEPELADLKAPASVPPNYRPLLAAAVVLALLLVAAAVLWWLQRRYGSRLAAVEGRPNLFDRVAPHEWVYAELQKLLERHLPDRGEVDEFFEELSRILKTYLGGRFRVDLMERTTHEVAPALVQAGAPDEIADDVERLLELADRVKFARERPDVAACRAAVDEVYAIVDRTKPLAPPAESRRGAA